MGKDNNRIENIKVFLDENFDDFKECIEKVEELKNIYLDCMEQLKRLENSGKGINQSDDDWMHDSLMKCYRDNSDIIMSLDNSIDYLKTCVETLVDINEND